MAHAFPPPLPDSWPPFLVRLWGRFIHWWNLDKPRFNEWFVMVFIIMVAMTMFWYGLNFKNGVMLSMAELFHTQSQTVVMPKVRALPIADLDGRRTLTVASPTAETRADQMKLVKKAILGYEQNLERLEFYRAGLQLQAVLDSNPQIEHLRLTLEPGATYGWLVLTGNGAEPTTETPWSAATGSTALEVREAQRLLDLLPLERRRFLARQPLDRNFLELFLGNPVTVTSP